MTTKELDRARPHLDQHHRPTARVAAHTPSPDTRAVASRPPHPLLRLQQLHGNRYVQRLVQERHARATVPIQCKLTVSQPGDPYEREADAIADAAVASAPEPAAPILNRYRLSSGAIPERPLGPDPASHVVARKAAGGGPCPSAPSEEEAAQAQAGQQQEEETPVMAKASGSAVAPVSRLSGPPGLEERLAARKGTGAPLPAIARTELEARLGHTFGDVRVHTDGEAADITRSLAAEAFTTGSDLYFGPGRFDPHSVSGRRLLAHELVHVVQQRPNAQPAGGPTQIQRYALAGFPDTERGLMNQAIPIAKDTVDNCDDVNWVKTQAIKETLQGSIYIYDAKLGLCGWTFPMSKYIKIGKEAFAPGCCKLESTLAHEAAHVSFSTEGGARKLEKDCFGCT